MLKLPLISLKNNLVFYTARDRLLHCFLVLGYSGFYFDPKMLASVSI